MFKSKDDEIPQFTSLKLRLELEGPFALSFLAGTPCLNRNFQIPAFRRYLLDHELFTERVKTSPYPNLGSAATSMGVSGNGDTQKMRVFTGKRKTISIYPLDS